MNRPDRGEVWMIDLGLAAKVRPCLILSIPVLDQDRALATVVAHTTSPRGSRFEVNIRVKFLKEGVFDAQNLVTIPLAKMMRKMGILSKKQLVESKQRCAYGLVFNMVSNNPIEKAYAN